MDQNKLKVSVVMISYNHEKYIEEAINGVLMQEVDFDLELIIADDNSPDNTETIVKNIILSHPNRYSIKYTKHINNKGMMPNFVWALNQCNGKYIALCEGDDYWTDPLKLQKQVDFLEANEEYVGAFHNTLVVNEISGEQKCFRIEFKKKINTKDCISTIVPFHTASLVYKSSALKQLPNFFSTVASGDMSLFFLLSLKGDFFGFNDFMSVYRINEGGITYTQTHKGIKYHINRIKLWRYIKNYISDSIYIEDIEKVINTHINRLTSDIINQYNVLNAFLVLLKHIEILQGYNIIIYKTIIKKMINDSR